MELNGKKFDILIDEGTIQCRIIEIAEEINKEYEGKNPLFIGIMNGCFMFASDLFKRITVPAEISFIKLLSYKGTSTTNKVVHSIGLEQTVKDRHVIILEDIVDTGTTLHSFLPELKAQNPASIKIASCLFKPKALKHDITSDYIGFSVGNSFVVGYGLDYDGYGRNNKNIYSLNPKYQ
jgi:hypoxanthine phosphoribosyltransferase